jgi:hypothetical protein
MAKEHLAGANRAGADAGGSHDFALEKALAKTHGARSAREIAFHLSECFEEAEFLVAL